MDILQDHKRWQPLSGRKDLGYWSYVVLMLYILTMPFVSAFAFTGTISWPLILAVFLFLVMLVKIIQAAAFPSDFIGFDLVIIFLFLLIVAFSFLINGWGNSKSLNHTVAYLSTFLLFYVAIKFTLFSAPDKKPVLKRTLQFITYTTIISALYGNTEFISANVFHINLNDYIPRPTEDEAWYDATVLGVFFRARGFAPESGHFAFMMELFSPLTMYYLYFSPDCKWPKFLRALTVAVIVFSFIFAVSTASFAILPLAVLFAALIYSKSIFLYIKKKPTKFIITTAAISGVTFLFNYFLSIYALIILSISNKMDSFSLYDRQERIDFFNNKFSHLPFFNNLIGTGPAGYNILGYDESRAILSLYYSITFELGYLGLLMILLFFLYIIFQTLKIRAPIGFFLLVSVFSGVMHYYFISNFWYPWFWFIAAFVVFYNVHNKQNFPS
ncbi:MAG: O-antigen ligase family protein [Ginsengibacter sp.]